MKHVRKYSVEMRRYNTHADTIDVFTYEVWADDCNMARKKAVRQAGMYYYDCLSMVIEFTGYTSVSDRAYERSMKAYEK